MIAVGVLGALVGLSVAPPAASAGPAQPTDPWVYRPPVEAAVTDPFRPPPERWMAGNRGIKYAAGPGTAARAIGPGVVTFAGPVAGTLHVTVRHPDGLRSSYSFVASIRVRVGQRVGAGDVVAVTGQGLHLGVRRGDTYIDPASLWGQRAGTGQVVLVPLDPHRSAVEAQPWGPGARPAPGWASVDAPIGGYGRAVARTLDDAVASVASAVAGSAR